MGYGSRAVELLGNYYEGKFLNLSEQTEEDEQIDNVPEEVSVSFCKIVLVCRKETAVFSSNN